MPVMAQLMDDLVKDPWREVNRFTSEMAQANVALLTATDDAGRAGALSEWLRSTNQPCLFARIAVTDDLIHYCFL